MKPPVQYAMMPPRIDAPKIAPMRPVQQPKIAKMRGIDEALDYYLGGTGVPDKLRAINSMFNPVEAVGGSMRASQRLFAPETDGWGRVQALGDMLSGVGGFVAPMVAASKVGGPVASAVVDAFTGMNTAPATQAAKTTATDFATKDFGGMKVSGGGRGTGTQRGQAVAPDLGSGAVGNASSAGDIPPGGTYAVASQPYRPRSGYPGQSGTPGYAPVGRVGDWDSGVSYGARPEFVNAIQDTARGSTTPTWRMLPDGDPQSREVFARGLAEAKASQGPYGAAVDANPAEAYANQRVFVAGDGQGYFSVAPTGEINAVAGRKGSGIRGLPDTALNVATQNGGRWLSVFDTNIAEKYADSGFKPVARVPFNPEYAPDGWDAKTMGQWNNGQPDVVFMEYDPSYTGGYTPGSAAQSVPEMSYDDASALMSQRADRTGLREAYEARAGQMELKAGKRVNANPNRERFVDSDYHTPAPGGTFEDLALKYPRNPNPNAPLPKGDRARILVDRRGDIADKLAEKIRASGQMEKDTRYFYHSDGPLYRAAIKAGLSDEAARSWLSDFGNYFAATSPRTKVVENARNATSAMAKEAQGIGFRAPVGPGTGGLSERGYPMMTGKGGIHGQLLDQVTSGRGIDLNTNTKPGNFGPNMVGNRSSVTVDTHAIRGIMQTLNEIDPGSVPVDFIIPKYRAAYAKDPSVLTPNMIMDTVGKQKIGPKGATYSAQTEYPVFADIYHDVADRLGVDPAEAQSMGWFGLGNETNLGSTPHTLADVFDQRLDVTARLLGIPVKEAARLVFNRKIPLMAGAGVGFMSQQQEPKAKPIGFGS
jgi:hypothetical protein